MKSRLFSFGALTLAATGLLLASPVWAVHKIGNIELDGNTVNDGVAVTGIDDWDDIYNGTGNALRSAFVIDSAVADTTAFSGGVKDTQSLDKWTCKTTGVQDKSDILHAYGATYSSGGDLFFYAGADREGNLGDSNMGVWLFQGPVSCVSNGETTPFTGTHLDGDLLLVSEFDNGGRVENVLVYRWSDPDGIPQNGDECLGGELGDCSDAGVPAYVGENCNDSAPGDRVCGRTNPVSGIDAAWRAGISKQSFYETGANITSLISGVGCFANAIIETRSSTSLTAQLKDFVSLDLSTCGTLTVEKETIGGNANFGFAVDPAAGNPGSFSLAGGENRFFATVEADTYTISENSMPAGPSAPNGWNLTDVTCAGGIQGTPNYSDGGHSGGDIDVAIGLGDDVVCTFTNTFTAPPGSITIQKLCDNTASGSQSFDFTLGGFGGSSTAACADGLETLACGESISCQGLAAGSYTVNESVPSGWELTDVSCIGNAICGAALGTQASITLAAADNAVATFTNTRNASIEICKSTVPQAAGGEFDFSGDLGNFTLVDGECSAVVEVAPGTSYDVVEAIEADFVLDGINCTGSNWLADAAGTRSVAITPEPGEAVSCTFTNYENPGYIQVCKTTVTTSDDNPAFEFELSGPDSDLPVSTSISNGRCDLGQGDVNEVTLIAGSAYAVIETPVDGWDSVIGCVGSGGPEDPANIGLSPGEKVVCTATNTQRGHVIVEKLTNPPGVSEIFNFTGDVTGNIGDGGMIDVEVLAGQYTSTETAMADWNLDSIVCDDDDSSSDGSTATFNVQAGEIVTCTFTNSYISVANGFISVRKETNPPGDPELFTFTGDVAGDIADQGALAVEVAPGQYTATEVAVAGWDLDSISCDDNDSVGDGSTAVFNVQAGEAVTCTFSNSKRGHIIIGKLTNPAGVFETFNFTGDVAGDIGDGGTIDVEVVAGLYESTETAVADWNLDSIICDDDDSSGNGSTATFNVQAGEVVTCTFTNSYVSEANGYIIVSKESNPPDDPELFTFTGNLSGDIADHGTLALEVAPGQYTTTEAAEAGWDLDGISCDDDDSFGDGTTATFNVTAGETVTCTFTNSKRGHMIVRKATDPQGDPETFNFSGDATGDIADGGLIDVEVPPGRYTTTESAQAGWDLDSIVCDDNNSSGTGPTAAFNVEAGETVTCQFNNVKRASVRVVKTTGGIDGEFCFDVTPAEDDGFFCINTSGGVGETTLTNLLPGAYGIIEQELSEDWVLISDNCSDGGNAGDIALEPGEELTCTFVNALQRPIPVNNAWVLLLLTFALLVTGWYFRPLSTRGKVG